MCMYMPCMSVCILGFWLPLQLNGQSSNSSLDSPIPHFSRFSDPSELAPSGGMEDIQTDFCIDIS